MTNTKTAKKITEYKTFDLDSNGNPTKDSVLHFVGLMTTYAEKVRIEVGQSKDEPKEKDVLWHGNFFYWVWRAFNGYSGNGVDDCEYGGVILAEILGFSGDTCKGDFAKGDEMANWARDNPKIWGNENGYGLVYNKRAFGGTWIFEDVINHFQGVANRLPN